MMYSSILDHSPDVCFARPAFPTMMKKLHTLSAVSPCVAHESSAGFACPLAVKVHRYILHGKTPQSVTSTKYLGVTFQHDAKWD